MKINVFDASALRVSGATKLAKFTGLLLLSASAVLAGVGITGAPTRVAWDVGSYAVAGTNTSDIVGDLWVSNATAGGTAISFSHSSESFVAPAIALQVGKNYITVYGTNVAGDVSSDTINIWRYNIDGSGQQAGSKYGRRVAGWLFAWGNNEYGQTNCPSGNTRAFPTGMQIGLVAPIDNYLTNQFTIGFNVAYGDAIAIAIWQPTACRCLTPRRRFYSRTKSHLPARARSTGRRWATTAATLIIGRLRQIAGRFRRP